MDYKGTETNSYECENTVQNVVDNTITCSYEQHDTVQTLLDMIHLLRQVSYYTVFDELSYDELYSFMFENC